MALTPVQVAYYSAAAASSNKRLKVWNGSIWVAGYTKVWTGTEWR